MLMQRINAFNIMLIIIFPIQAQAVNDLKVPGYNTAIKSIQLESGPIMLSNVEIKCQDHFNKRNRNLVNSLNNKIIAQLYSQNESSKVGLSYVAYVTLQKIKVTPPPLSYISIALPQDFCCFSVELRNASTQELIAKGSCVAYCKFELMPDMFIERIKRLATACQ